MIKKVIELQAALPRFTRQQLKNFNLFVKDVFSVKSLKHINPVYLMEVLIPKKLDDKLIFVCVSVTDWEHPVLKKVVCDFNNHVIEIRSDLYSAVTTRKSFISMAVMRNVCRFYLLWLYYFIIKEEDNTVKNRKNSSC